MKKMGSTEAAGCRIDGAQDVKKEILDIDPNGELWITSGDTSNPYSWVDECPEGQTCYRTVAAVVGRDVRVYGSSSAQDIRPYPAKNGLINVLALSKDPDANFVSIQTRGQEENYLRITLAAALFNVSLEYHSDNPGDSKLVFTGGTTATGESAVYQSGTRQGIAIHPGHDWSIDLRYMDASGRPTNATRADPERARLIISLFDRNGLHFAITGDPSNFGFGPRSAQFRQDHISHLHFQPAPRRAEPKIRPGQR
jgi:hypothetical protein